MFETQYVLYTLDQTGRVRDSVTLQSHNPVRTTGPYLCKPRQGQIHQQCTLAQYNNSSTIVQ